jgi:HK97 family phage portal protein
MIIFQKVRWKNFLSTGNSFTEIDLQRSTNTLIIGNNGAGKSTILDILNTRANIGENSYIFRYRMSSQILLGTRGAFIEKVRGRDGGIIGLNLLPPQHTSPIPDPKTFVSGYEVLMPSGDKVILKPQDVCWIRRPHPIDPYLSLTPMESAGIAIEIENLAKLYNRNFLLNDGRPGGLLVLRGEIDDDDKEELRSRFRGNLGRVGSTTVVSADDGVDFVDTSSSPRDAAYIQMRQITKEEILASFGVPESVIGNASGRTFSNASEEIRVFWNETMGPHLEILARALDELDDDNYVDFDTSSVPVLIMAKQEVERYVLEEFRGGMVTLNEYREATGRKPVESELADSLLMNPNLTPVGNTKKPMAPPQQGMPMPGMPPGAPGMPPGMPGMPGMPPEMAGGAPGAAPDPTTMAGAMALEQAATAGMPGMPPEMAGAPTPAAPGAFGQMSASSGEMSFKEDASDIALTRWTEILDRSLERVMERSQRVVLEKLGGQKSRKSLSQGALDVSSILQMDVWGRQMDEDIRPVLSAIIKDSKINYAEKWAMYTPPTNEETVVNIDAQMGRIKAIYESCMASLTESIFNSYGIQNEDERYTALRTSVNTTFTDMLANQRPKIASTEAKRAWDFCRP